MIKLELTKAELTNLIQLLEQDLDEAPREGCLPNPICKKLNYFKALLFRTETHFWKKLDCSLIPTNEMSDTHLKNALNKFEPFIYRSAIIDKEVTKLKNELNARKMLY